ncbi:MAG: amidase family protein, partial [Rhodospirillales bacterium]
IEAGLKLDIDDIRRAIALQRDLYRRFVKFFETHDLLVLPTAQHPPFPVEKRYVDEINGQKLDTYVDWILITSIITMTGCPAISIPCGFTKSGLPVGLQLVGRPRGEAALLSAAHLMEQVFGLAAQLPIDPVVRH